MKKLLIVFAFFVLASTTKSYAQETWSIGPVPISPVNYVQKTINIIVVENIRICRRWSVPPLTPLSDTCTQAQACTNAGAIGGASCTAANARAAGARIYPNTQAGREEFVTHRFVIPGLDRLEPNVPQFYRGEACKNWEAANNTVKEQKCVSEGAPVPATLALGCDLSCK